MFETEQTGIAGDIVAGLVTLAVVLTAAVYLELKEKRIPNWLTLSGMSMGLLLGAIPGGLTLGSSVAGLLIGFGFLFIFYVFGGVGGGDVKLMGTIGALLGRELIVPALFYTAVVGGFMAIVVLIWRRSLWRGLAHGFRRLLRLRRPPEWEMEPRTADTIPYGIAIAAGSILALFAGG